MCLSKKLLYISLQGQLYGIALDFCNNVVIQGHGIYADLCQNKDINLDYEQSYNTQERERMFTHLIEDRANFINSNIDDLYNYKAFDYDMYRFAVRLTSLCTPYYLPYGRGY